MMSQRPEMTSSQTDNCVICDNDSEMAVEIAGKVICKRCVNKASYALRVAMLEQQTLDGATMRKDELEKKVALIADAEGLCRHLYGWSGRELHIINRLGSGVTVIDFGLGSHEVRMEEAGRAIRVAVKSKVLA